MRPWRHSRAFSVAWGIVLLVLCKNVFGQCASGFTGVQCENIDMSSPPAEMRLQVLKNSESRTFNLKNYDVRANLKVKLVDANGQVTEPAITPSTNQYIGYVEEESGSIVTATLLPNGSLHYKVSTGDGTDDWEYIPTEETNPASIDISYTVIHGTPLSPNGAAYQGATPVVTGRGGLSDDGKQYESHLGFVVSKNYTDSHTSDINSIVRKAETSVVHMNGHMLRDVLVESRVHELLIRLDDTPAYTTAREQFSNYGMDNLSNNIFTVLTGSGGGAPGCRNGGDPSDTDEQFYSQAFVSGSSDGTWYGILRHEYGHSLGSGHFSGNSPEGATIMSGNSKSKFSGDEIRDMEWCYMPKGTDNFKAEYSAYTAHEVPPSARLDNHVEIDAQGNSQIDVLVNDYDVNGDSIAIAGFDAASALGGTVSFIAQSETGSRDMLQYVPQNPGNLPVSCGELCESEDLLLWLDASDKNSLIDVNDNSGDDLQHLAALKTWLDKTDNNNDAIIYNSPTNPELHLLGDKAIGGLPTVLIDDDMMEIRSLDLREETHEEITSIAVVKLASDYSELWVQKQNGSARREHRAARQETVKSLTYDSNLLTQWTGMSDKEEQNISLDPTGIGIALGTGIYPWDGYSGAYHVEMSVAEILIFKRKLSDNERQDIEKYLAIKWSLKINDQFNYTIVDSTGRTSQGRVVVPWIYDAPTDLSHLDNQLVHIRNRKDCDNGSRCNWHMSWFGGKSYIVTDTNVYDLVPWRLKLVPGTTNQFYIHNEWGGVYAYRFGDNLQFNDYSGLEIVNSTTAWPWEVFLIPGTSNEYYLRSKYQCEEAHFRCNSPVTFGYADRVLLDIYYNEPIPWSIEPISN